MKEPGLDGRHRDQTPPKTGKGAGVLGGSLLVALLLYIASPMPVSFAINRYHLGIPPAVPRFYRPFKWASEHTALKKPIDRYGEFLDRLGR